MMEVVQRWSEYGDFSWGFIDRGNFFPLHVSEAYVEEVSRQLEAKFYPGYFEDEGWKSDETHFTLKVHPADLPPEDPNKFTVIEKPKAAYDGRFFREDDE
jgi:hypothetical protein